LDGPDCAAAFARVLPLLLLLAVCMLQALRLRDSKAGKALEKSLDDIIFAYSYPRLDVEVTKKMNHLLKVRRKHARSFVLMHEGVHASTG
jgi:hypothetical protein